MFIGKQTVWKIFLRTLLSWMVTDFSPCKLLYSRLWQKQKQTMTTFMPPPPAATFLAFYPEDNNIIAIGMEDSSIQIYNVQIDEVKAKLKGHQKRITGLAFSNSLNVLVSSGADSQVIPNK